MGTARPGRQPAPGQPAPRLGHLPLHRAPHHPRRRAGARCPPGVAAPGRVGQRPGRRRPHPEGAGAPLQAQPGTGGAAPLRPAGRPRGRCGVLRAAPECTPGLGGLGLRPGRARVDAPPALPGAPLSARARVGRAGRAGARQPPAPRPALQGDGALAGRLHASSSTPPGASPTAAGRCRTACATTLVREVGPYVEPAVASGAPFRSRLDRRAATFNWRSSEQQVRLALGGGALPDAPHRVGPVHGPDPHRRPRRAQLPGAHRPGVATTSTRPCKRPAPPGLPAGLRAGRRTTSARCWRTSPTTPRCWSSPTTACTPCGCRWWTSTRCWREAGLYVAAATPAESTGGLVLREPDPDQRPRAARRAASSSPRPGVRGGARRWCIRALEEERDARTGERVFQLVLRAEDAQRFGWYGERVGDVCYFQKPRLAGRAGPRGRREREPGRSGPR